MYVKCHLLLGNFSLYTSCTKVYDFLGHDSLILPWSALPFFGGVHVRMHAHKRALFNIRFRAFYLVSPMVTETSILVLQRSTQWLSRPLGLKYTTRCQECLWPPDSGINSQIPAPADEEIGNHRCHTISHFARSTKK